MAVYKDNATGTWRVIYRFTNWKGERKQTQKRGFATKREAQAWEHEAMLKQGAKLDMTFASFFEVYEADKKQRVKESTWESKSHVIRTKILPYFGNRKIAEIEAKDIIQEDRNRHKATVLLNDFSCPVLVGELGAVLIQIQNDSRSLLFPGSFAHLELRTAF